VFTISSWVCGRGFGRAASLQILAIAKLLLWFAPRNPSPTASPTPSFEIMNTFLGPALEGGVGPEFPEKMRREEKIFLIKKSLFRTKNQYFSS
jgi:hypothetical protein